MWTYEVFDGGDLLLDVALTSASSRSVTVRDSLGGIVASGSVNGEAHQVCWPKL